MTMPSQAWIDLLFEASELVRRHSSVLMSGVKISPPYIRLANAVAAVRDEIDNEQKEYTTR